MININSLRLQHIEIQETEPTVYQSPFGIKAFKKFMLFLRMATLLFGLVTNASAQQIAPVLANTQVSLPYSPYLSDYAASGSNKLQVNLFLKDLAKTNYPCRLRIKIEGFGITIQSKNDFAVPALYLNGGELSVISGSDLEAYFNPQNLVFQGLDQAEFARNGGKLPEGIYKFTVEVIDYYRKSLVSNSALSVVSIFLAYPPIINQPLDQSKLSPLDPQNVVFQWTPRSTGSINSAYNIAYKFRLVEIIPADRNPNDAIRTSRPLYETYTDQTVLVYGLTEPALIPGNSYAVQVQAVDAEGRDLFVNNGNSEVVKFNYGDKCASPKNILAELSGMNAIRVSWNADPLQQAFTIRYREANKPGAQWFEQEVFTPNYTLQGLRSSTRYEFQVKAQCSYGYGDYSEMQTFDVPDETLSKGDFVCGQAETLPAEEQGFPLPVLVKDMIFFAGKFPVVVTEASGQNGTFSGTGTVGVPFFKSLSFKVQFKDIKINIKLKLTEGKVVFSRQTLDESIDQVIANITVKPDSNGNVNAISANGLPTIVDAAMVWPGPMPVYDAKAKTVKFSASVDEGTPKEITIKLQNGQPPLVFQDKNNETFSVDKDGVVKHLGMIPPKELLAGGSSTNYAVNTDKARVDFLAPNQRYGLDEYREELGSNSTYASAYQSLGDEGTDKPKYCVSRKSVESQQTEEIQARITITDKELAADKLEFKTGTGEKLSATQSGNTYTINIIGALPNNDKEIYAYHPDAAKGGANIGKLNISAFGKISKKVVLVPVNGRGASLNPQTIQDALNKIYSQAVVEWQVELADNFDAQNPAFDELETANSNVMSAYTNGQKALIKAYRQSHKLENGTYYIFLVKSLSDGSAGYMVRGGQVGFVATSKGDLERTIAHELGHGAFMLQHTWDNPGLAEGKTQNLMDYSGGTELWYSQWKYMRNPDLIFRPFEGDSEGASATAMLKSTYSEEDYKNATVLKFANNEPTGIGEFYYRGYKITFIQKNNNATFDAARGVFVITQDGKQIELKVLFDKGTNLNPVLVYYSELQRINSGNSTYKISELQNANAFYPKENNYTIVAYKDPLPAKDLVRLKEKLKNLEPALTKKIIALLESLPLNDVSQICSSYTDCYDIFNKQYTATDWNKIIELLEKKKNTLNTGLERLAVLDQLNEIKKLLDGDSNTDKICRLILADSRLSNNTLTYPNFFKMECLGTQALSNKVIFRVELLGEFILPKVEHVFYITAPAGSSIVNEDQSVFSISLSPQQQEANLSLSIRKGTSGGEALSKVVGKSSLILALVGTGGAAAIEAYAITSEFYATYLAVKEAECLKNMAFDVGLQLAINRLVKEYSGTDIPFSYTSVGAACAIGYMTNMGALEACGAGAIISLGDNALSSLKDKKPQPIHVTVSQAVVGCLITGALHHVATNSYTAILNEALHWYYIKNFVKTSLTQVQKGILSRFRISYSAKITDEILGTIVNQSGNNLDANVKILEEYFEKEYKIISKGDEIVVEDVNKKTIAKFTQGKFVVEGVGSLVFKGDIGKIYDVFINAGYRQERVGDVINLFSKENKLVAEVSEKSIRFKYQGWGKDIITNSERTTTCIAKFDDLLDAPGSKWIKYDLPEGSFGRGQLNKGGINILDVDDDTFLKLNDRAYNLLKNRGIVNPSNNQIIKEANEIFWTEYNLPFLEQAFARGDDIRLLSEPQTLFSSIGFYQREIEVINVGWTKPDGTFIEPLKSKYNYKFNDITKTYEKIR